MLFIIGKVQIGFWDLEAYKVVSEQPTILDSHLVVADP